MASRNSNIRIAVLFDNFGPYHIARLNAAATVAEILGVEFAAASHEYAWDWSPTATRFVRRTLFTNGSSVNCETRELRRALRTALGDFRPDAVAIPGWSGRMAFAALSWCLASGVPAIVMSESTMDDIKRASWKEAIKRRCVGACAAALAGGRRQQDYLVQLGMPGERVFLGYDAVDNDHFSKGAVAAQRNADAERARLGLPRRYFLASARFVEKKNLDGLVRAWARYRSLCEAVAPEGGTTAWDLVLLGDGPLRKKLVRLCDELDVRGHVHLPGFQQYDALPTYYGLAGALVHASRVEQWGLVINEALAAALPVIISHQCGCTAELLANGKNGYAFDAEDELELAKCLQRMSALSDEERQAMGRRGAAIVGDFGPARFAQGLLHAAESAMASPRRSHWWIDAILLRGLLSHAR
jgi:1,2-diacylglycerol 3-alpha-glucosyltransferase